MAPVSADVGAVGDEGAVAFEADVLGGGVEVAGEGVAGGWKGRLVRYGYSRRLF
jgi:hypothetical protein